MPNHVVNIISLKGSPEEIKKLRETVKNDEYGLGTIDFNKIIPMPEELHITHGSKIEEGLKHYKDFIYVYNFAFEVAGETPDINKITEKQEKVFLNARNDIDKETWELGKQGFWNLQKYGAASWYDWACNHWNTKWNAYGYDGGGDYSEIDGLYCQTAWSAPHPVIEKISEMFPEVEIIHEWADEDLGQNCGHREYAGGQMFGEYFPETEKEALEFAAGVWDFDLADVGLVLNATKDAYIRNDNENYELIEVAGQKALFTNDRLKESNIPNGMYLYHLRHSDSGTRFCSVEKNVAVNHGGSIVTCNPMDLDSNGCLFLTEETEPNFLGVGEKSFEDLMRIENGELDITNETESQEYEY